MQISMPHRKVREGLCLLQYSKLFSSCLNFTHKIVYQTVLNVIVGQDAYNAAQGISYLKTISASVLVLLGLIHLVVDASVMIFFLLE